MFIANFDPDDSYISEFIIKFLYNARSHWFKQRASGEYKARNQRKFTPSSAEMVDEFPNFFLGINQEIEEYFLYDLDNEEEKQFLPAVDLMAVNVTDKVDKVTVEKANKSTEVNKHRFVNQTQELSVKGLLGCPVKCFE